MAESDLKTFLEAARELKVLGLTDTSAFRDLRLAGAKPVLKEKDESQPNMVAAPQQQPGSNLYLNPGTTAATAGNSELVWLSDGDMRCVFMFQIPTICTSKWRTLLLASIP